MLSSRSIAVQGLGFGPRHTAVQGFVIYAIPGGPGGSAGGFSGRPYVARIQQNAERIVIAVEFLLLKAQQTFIIDDSDSPTVKISELRFLDPECKISTVEKMGDTIRIVNIKHT
jgi:hypothetical protein